MEPTEQPATDSEQGLLERLETALTPAEEPQTEAVEASQEQGQEQPSEQPDDGFVDLELEDGDTYRVPQKLKDGYLRQSDYTKKTQELAALQKQVTFNVARQKETQQFEQETQEDRAKLSQIQAEIQRYKSADLTNLDTDAYIRARGYLDNLRDQAADLERTLQTKANTVRQRLEQQRGEAVQAAYEFIGKHVKGFAPQSDAERDVAQYAQSFGVPANALGEIAVMFPGIAVMAAKASQFDKLQAGKTDVIKQAQKAPPVVKPGAVTSTNTATAQRDKVLRTNLKKSGSLQDAAALFEMRKY